MKKVFFIVLMILLICSIVFIPIVAMADDGVSPPGMQEFFTWGLLATYAGCLSVTILFTQFLKGIWPQKWPVQYLSYLIAFAVLVLSGWALETLTWRAIILSLFNAVIISFAANGGYENIIKPILNKIVSSKKTE
jgi:hypothetical protein